MDFSNEMFYQDLIGVCFVDEDYKFLKVNEVLEGFLGFKSHELNDKPMKVVLSSRDLGRLNSVFERVKQTKIPSCYLQNFTTQDKGFIIATVVVRAIFDGDGNFKYFVMFVFDYMNYFSSTADFKTDDLILRKTFDSVDDVVFFKDEKLRYKVVNQTFLKRTKLKLKDVIGKKDDEIFPKELADDYNKRNQEAINSDAPYNYVNSYHKKGDDKSYSSRVTLHKISDENGNFLGILGIARDLELDIKLKYRQGIIQNMFEHSSEGMVITDEKQKIIATNKAFANITGYSQDEVIGLKPTLLASGKHSKKFYKNMWSEIEKNGLWCGEIINKRKNGQTYPELLTISCVKDDNGSVINYTGIFSDIVKLKETELKLQHMAKNDPLTGLPNKISLEFSVEQIIKRAKRGEYGVGFLYFDIDNFKEINDAFGHSIGDKVIIQVAKRLTKSFREVDMVFRVGGDEFMLIVEDFESVKNLKTIIDKVFHIFQYPFIVHDKIFNTTCSLGVSVYPEDGDDMDSLYKNADAAMYEAKNAGKNSFCFYTKSITNALFEKVEIENDMRRGLENDEFFVLYQPQIDMTQNKAIGAEALVRWMHPTKGIVAPDLFISIAEENKMITKIGAKVLDIVCEDIKSWLDVGYDLTNFRVSVNVSAVQLKDDNMYERIKSTTKRAGILPKYLKVELTETSIMDNTQKVIDLFNKLRHDGVRLSIDDFGTGYSSFAYLKKFATSEIKIDRTFIKNIPRDKDDVAITKTILALGKSMELEVIAEGLEDAEHREFLLQEGCDKAQGYFYSKPITKEEFEEKFLKTFPS